LTSTFLNYGGGPHASVNTTNSFIAKNVKVIADLQLVRKVFVGLRVFTLYERDKHELGCRVRLFRVTMLKKKVIKALRHNY
jgi:hypothetical protein